MNGVELYRLGRRLMKIGERAIAGSAGPAPAPSGVRLILEDISAHPNSTIGEITARTGFPQSHVSASVARFRERGAVRTAADPADGRRTLVRLDKKFSRRVAKQGAAPVDDVLSEELEASEPEAVAEIVRTLELLASQVFTGEGGKKT